jgi:hypothetical protein
MRKPFWFKNKDNTNTVSCGELSWLLMQWEAAESRISSDWQTAVSASCSHCPQQACGKSEVYVIPSAYGAKVAVT